ncbi:MAG: hypothetical protein PHV42_02145 [Candidatus Pacebacteria bacterium]|nr:hypothetical protein [Candidatus Paceibacterota bacterium]
MNNKNSAIVVVIVAALLIGGLAGYYISTHSAIQTPAPQTSGGTDADTIEGNSLPSPQGESKYLSYENKQYGFSLTYPMSLSLAPGSGAIVDFKSANNAEIRVLKIADSDSDFQNVLIQNTYYDGSGANPKSFAEFKNVTIGENSFYFIKTGLFEGVLTLHYYAVRPTGIYDFSLISRGVDWTNPNFNVQTEEGHLYLQQILGTLSFFSPTLPTPSPAKPVSFLEYRSDESGYTIQYPSNFFVNESGKNPLNGTDPFYGIFFNFPSSFTAGTNLSKESYISVETKAEVQCTPGDFLDQGGGPSPKPADIQSNGIYWTGGFSADAAVGNLYEETAYTTIHNGTCYGVKLFLHSGNIGNYDPGTIRSFDADTINSIFKGMVSSISFL